MHLCRSPSNNNNNNNNNNNRFLRLFCVRARGDMRRDAFFGGGSPGSLVPGDPPTGVYTLCGTPVPSIACDVYHARDYNNATDLATIDIAAACGEASALAARDAGLASADDARSGRHDHVAGVHIVDARSSAGGAGDGTCLLYTSPSPRDA